MNKLTTTIFLLLMAAACSCSQQENHAAKPKGVPPASESPGPTDALHEPEEAAVSAIPG